MGLQDRDYMKARHQQRTSQENADSFKSYTGKSTEKSKSPLHPLVHGILSLFMLAMFMFFMNGLYQTITSSKAGKTSEPKIILKLPFIKTPEPELIPGGLILRSDSQGHFRGTVLINNVPMPFIIDTGATQITIPAKLALAAGLPFGQSFSSETAGGLVTDRKTHIDSFKLGTAEIKNLEGGINDHLQEVLIGVNTLKFFKMITAPNTLTLVAYTKPEEMAAIASSLSVPVPYQAQAPLKRLDYPPSVAPLSSYDTYQRPKTKWKKSVICEGTHCKTLYDQSR